MTLAETHTSGLGCKGRRDAGGFTGAKPSARTPGRQVCDANMYDANVRLSHFFNHQTHHRGQVTAIFAQTEGPYPELDMHRVLIPDAGDAGD